MAGGCPIIVTMSEPSEPSDPEPAAPAAGEAPDGPDGSAGQAARVSHWRGWFAVPVFGGLVGALVFWWQSLTPSMMPRSPLAQAAVGAVCIGAGTAVGTLIHAVVAWIVRWRGSSVAPRVARIASLVLAGLAAVAVVLGWVLWPMWQNDQRDVVGGGHVSAWSFPVIIVVTAILTVVVVLIGRAVWRLGLLVERLGSKLLPRPAAAAITVVVVVFALNLLVSNVVLGRLHSWANSAFGVLEEDTGDVEPPTSALVSGGPGSLVPWSDLGLQGRNFVTGATTTADLAAFSGGDVEEPIRVYAGLRSGDDAAERSAVVVDELERTGAFDRSVLVVATATGTGWIDPDAAVAIEQLWHGDTAIASIQYSFLPSWISTLVDGDVAQEAGAALFNAVYDRWSELPEGQRPLLLVFGQSLGSFGGEAAFAGHDAATSIANMVARTDGVLFTGPTNGNTIWNQLTDGRDPGSPAWQPVVDGGSTVRFVSDVDELRGAQQWEHPRVLYVQHPTDPVTFWDVPTMWSKPEWLDRPRGAGIPDRATWFPFVTWAQGVGDLAAGFGAEPGFGHDYSNAFVGAWAAIAAPEGWTDAETDRLEAFLAG